MAVLAMRQPVRNPPPLHLILAKMPGVSEADTSRQRCAEPKPHGRDTAWDNKEYQPRPAGETHH
jgi:hypothetical protein